MEFVHYVMIFKSCKIFNINDVYMCNDDISNANMYFCYR
jgi:hypothetical protein